MRRQFAALVMSGFALAHAAPTAEQQQLAAQGWGTHPLQCDAKLRVALARPLADHKNYKPQVTAQQLATAAARLDGQGLPMPGAEGEKVIDYALHAPANAPLWPVGDPRTRNCLNVGKIRISSQALGPNFKY